MSFMSLLLQPLDGMSAGAPRTTPHIPLPVAVWGERLALPSAERIDQTVAGSRSAA
jgi:hypothetical protein